MRGATTLDADDPQQMNERVRELVVKMFADNGVEHDDVISMLFTATSDISSTFPASAARSLGLDDVPLIGAQELDVDGMVPLCVRVMAHVETDLPRSEISHIFLHGARSLRTDLVK